MPHNPYAEIEQTLLDMIEHSPVGAVPRTPSYTEALHHLYTTRQVYAHADHRDGHVTARSLSARPAFHASNLQDFIEGRIEADALEANNAIFDRYLASLPAALRARAEAFRMSVAGRPIHHRMKSGTQHARDPLNTVFLIPGGGPQPALPGNYLHGGLSEYHDSAHPLPWCIHLNDSTNDSAMVDFASLPEALAMLSELLAMAPFHLHELEAFGFRIH